MTEIDSLSISIKADAKTAGNAIDDLVDKLTGLTVALGKIDGNDKLSGFSQGVQAFATAMQGFKGIGTEKFNAITTGLTNLSNISAQGLNTVSGSITNISNSLGILSRIQFDNKNIQSLINSLTRMAKADISELSKVDFTSLGNSLNNLATSLQNAPKIEQSVIAMTKAITSLSKYGGNMPVVASSLGALGNSLTMFMSTMANAPRITDSALAFTQAISSLAGAGAKAGVTASNLSALGVGIRNIMTTLSAAPKVSQNVIDMTNALANLSAQGSKVGSASRNMVYGLNRTSRSADRAKKSFSGLASVIGKFYANYFLVVRGFKALWKSIGSTADYIESYNYFNVALGKIGSDWAHQWEKYADKIGVSSAEEYADSFATRLEDKLKPLSGISVEVGADGKGLLSTTGMKNLGLNIQEVTQYASQLASVTNSLGQTGEVSLATSSAFTKLGADMSSLFNVDYSSVMQNLQSGLIGQSRALYKYGIDITNATLQTYAYKLGLTKAVSEMTQAEKQQLRMIAILDQSRVSWGDLANTIESPSNLMRQFKNNLKETGMVLGQLFIPMLQYTLPVINGVTIAVKELLVSLAQLMGITIDFDAFGEGFNQTEEFEGLQEEIDGATESLKKYKNQAMDFDEINPIKGVDDSASLGNLTGGSIDLTDEILKATEEYEKAWQESYDNMESRSQEIANRIVNGFKNAFKNAGWYGVGNYISSGIADSLKNADFDSVHKGLENVARNIANFLNGLITPDLLGNVGKSFAKSLNAVINAKATLAETLDFEQVGDSIAEGINEFFDTFDFERLGESINKWVKGLGTALVEAVKEIDWSDVIKGLGDLITELDTETLAILGGLGLLRSGGLKSLIFGNGINLGGAGGAGGTTTGGFNLNSLLFGKNLGGGISFGNAGLFGTLALGLGAGSIGTDIGKVLGYLATGDAELYLNYNVKDAFLEIANAIIYEPEEIKNAFINILEDAAHWIDDSAYDITKPVFEKLDDIFWFSAKHGEDWKDLGKAFLGEPIKNDAQAETYRQIAEGETPTPWLNHWDAAGKWLIGDATPWIEKLDDALWFSAKHDEDWKTLGDAVKHAVGIGDKGLRKTEELIGKGNRLPKSKNESVTWQDYSHKNQGWKSFLPDEDMKAKGQQAMLDFFEGMKEKSESTTQIASATTNIASQLVTMYGKLSGKAKDQGKGLVWNLGNGITVNQTQATSAFETLASSLLTVANDKYKAIKENVLSKGKGIATNFGTGMTDNKNKVTNAFGGLSTALSKVMNTKYDTLKTNITGKGEGLVWNLGNAITTNKKSATDPITKIFNSIGKIASSTTVTDKFESAGVNIIKGLISGLRDKKSLSNLATTVAGLGKSVAGIFTGVLDIHSPSRLFEKYAMYTIQGYNIGLEKYAPTTLDSMEDWSGSIANTSFSMEYPSVSANSEELLLLRQQNMLLQALLNKEIVEIKGDAKQIFRVVQKQANNYTIQTGEPAFSF